MPHSKKSKPAPAKKPSAAKPAKHAPVKKPATQHKTISRPKPAAAKPKPAPAKPAPAKPAPAKHHQPAKAHVPSSHKPSSKPVPEKKAQAAKAPEPLKPAAKASSKPAPAAKAAPVTPHSPAAKPTAHAKPTSVAAKPGVTPSAKPAGAVGKAAGKAAAKADALRARILERRTAKPIAFTLDEVREIAKVNVPRASERNGALGNGGTKIKTQAEEIEAKLKKASQPHFVKAASLADILGYNPAKQAAPTILSASEVDPKFQRYYKLLIELRNHVASGLDTHTEQTLKRSAKDDSGDLSGYAQHMADAGTDTFDRDFALSLVSNEQEALAEIEAAILRIKNGNYGVCELTGKPINKDRLLAVPFARFSVESQTEVERTKRRAASRAGLFGEGEDGGKIEDDGGSDD